VTWAEVIRKLKAAGFVEVRAGKGSHLLLRHPETGKEVWIAVHTRRMRGS
jgi:predicted RNA binding protein YcfA (HicA-like mRNA interferase family)